MIKPFLSLSRFSSLSGRDAAYTIHGFEVKIHPSEASSTGQVSSGSSKVSVEERDAGEEGEGEE